MAQDGSVKQLEDSQNIETKQDFKLSTKDKLLLLSIAFAELCSCASNTVLAPLYPEAVSNEIPT
jgi:hypothetical protein